MLDADPFAYHFDQSLIWHVVFHPGKTLWSRQFSHVSLAGYSNDTWLHLDVQRGGVNVASIYHHDEVQDYLTFILGHYTVLRFGPSQERPARTFLAPMTCVSFAKHVLRFRSCALRPDRLFSDLVRVEGTEVLNENPESRRVTGAETAAGSS
ncbi:MAG: hypothetical protein JKX76_00675 [Colwellia sp.]|nr:hypothetical protein [Colwellia sp.]